MSLTVQFTSRVQISLAYRPEPLSRCHLGAQRGFSGRGHWLTPEHCLSRQRYLSPGGENWNRFIPSQEISTKKETHVSITTFSSSWEKPRKKTFKLASLSDAEKANNNFFNRKPLRTALLLSAEVSLFLMLVLHYTLQNVSFGVKTKAQPSCRCYC